MYNVEEVEKWEMILGLIDLLMRKLPRCFRYSPIRENYWCFTGSLAALSIMHYQLSIIH